MFAHFILIACAAAFALSLSLAPLGCFLVWRRQAFFGDVMAHSAILGVALSCLYGATPLWGIIGICVALSALLAYGPALFKLPSDTWLGLLSYTLVAAGYIIMKGLPRGGASGSATVEQFLFGDILLLNNDDLFRIAISAVIVLGFLAFNWRSLVLITIDSEGASVDGISPKHMNFFLLMVLSCVVATTLPLVGALLVPGLLLLPAACAAQASRSPEGMVARAISVALLMILSGIGLGFLFDWPVGPASMIVGFVFFLMMRSYSEIKLLIKRSTP